MAETPDRQSENRGSDAESYRKTFDEYKQKFKIKSDNRMALLIGVRSAGVLSKYVTKKIVPPEMMWILLDILSENPGILEDLKIKRLPAARSETPKPWRQKGKSRKNGMMKDVW